MEGILIDTNVVLDVVTEDAVWAEWSQAQLDFWILRAPLLINPVVYAEASVRYPSIEMLEAALFAADLTLVEMPRTALFLAGKAFQAYRAAGGARTGVLPDFFIGAHAAVVGMPLVTRDAGRFRRYFPKLQLIAPESMARH